jgi:hypothetical protein
VEGVGSPWLKCRNRSGKLVVVHCHPAKGLWHQAVVKKLKDLEVSREEFEEWLRAGRKAG